MIRFVRWRDMDPRRPMLASARSRAAKKGLPFTITIDDIVLPPDMICPYLGIKMAFNHGSGKGAKPNSPTLDAIIPELSYQPGNVIVCSAKANTIKSNGTWQEHIQIAIKLKELTSASDAGSNDQGSQGDQVPGLRLT